MLPTCFSSLQAIRSVYSTSKAEQDHEKGLKFQQQSVDFSEKTQILNGICEDYFTHEIAPQILKKFISDINKILRNPTEIQENIGDLSKLFGNRGYFFQAVACPTSFSLILIGTVLRICGPKILISDSRFETIYLKITVRLFFNLDAKQRSYVEACIDRLKIIYTGFSAESIQLILDSYVAEVVPQSLNVDDIDELFQTASAYNQLRFRLLKSIANRDLVRKFLIELTLGKEDSYIRYFFDLDRSMREKLQKNKELSSLDMVKELSSCTEPGKQVYEKRLNVFESPTAVMTTVRTEIVFAGLSNPSRVNDLEMSIDEIQKFLLHLKQSLLNPISNFRVRFFYQKEIFEIFTSGAIFNGKLEKGGKNSVDQIQTLLCGRAYETMKTLFPQIVIQDVDSDAAIGTIIDLRLLTYFLPGEMTIFDRHVSVMKQTADINRINYFAVNCDAHSTLNRCQGMNVRRDHGSDHFQLLEGLKEFLTIQMSRVRGMAFHDPKMDVIFRKWNALCDIQNLKHERNTIPFVTLTLMLVKYINSNRHDEDPEIKMTIGCKSAKDRTFAVIPGVEILLYLIKNRMEEATQEAFHHKFHSLFSKDCYLDYSALSPHEKEVINKLFDPRIFYVSSDYSEGVSTNINSGVFSNSFFCRVPEFLNANIQTVSLWDIKS